MTSRALISGVGIVFGIEQPAGAGLLSTFIGLFRGAPRPRNRVGPHPHALPALVSLAPVISSNEVLGSAISVKALKTLAQAARCCSPPAPSEARRWQRVGVVTIASPAPPSSAGGSEPALRRELGRWDLTAIGINQVIGAGIFAQPAVLAAQAGAWSPWMVAAVGVASLLIALSFAEVGSRFEGTGGPYLYTRAAFGRFAAFEVGWMLWFTRAVSWAAVVNVLATALAFYLPRLGAGW